MRSSLLRPADKALRLGGKSILLSPHALLAGCILALIITLLLVFALTQGALPLTLREVYYQLTHAQAPASLNQTLFWQMRLPRSVVAIIAGAVLGAAGAVMQSTTRNGLADPSLLGIKETACLVVWIELLFFPTLSPLWRPISAMIAGLLVTGIVMLLARGTSGSRFILIGIGMSWGLNALLGVILTTLDPKQAQQLMLWMAGSLQHATIETAQLMVVIALPIVALLLYSCRASTILQLGDATATSLGVSPLPINRLRVIGAVILTALTVSTVGSIGFIGLMAPHLTRRMVSGGQSYLLCGSALVGALLLLLADCVGRLAFAPTQLPAGIIVALLGGPFLFILLWKRATQRQ